MALLEEAQKAARLLREHAYVRIVARGTDPDAICAAALLAHAMRRDGIDFHATWVPRVDAAALKTLADEANAATVLIGLGGDADAGTPPGRLVVLDRDGSPLPGEATLHGDAALASLAQLAAVALHERNVDLAPLALAGAVATRRHILGWRGLDERILDEATSGGAVLRGVTLNLRGGSLLTALATLDEPCVAGVTGRARAANKLVADLQLTGEAPPEQLPDRDAERVGSLLAAKLLQQHASDAALDALYRPRLATIRGPHTGLDATDLALLAEAACAAGRPGLAFAALWPDAAAAGELADVASAMRSDLVAALLKSEREMRREGALLWTDAKSAGLAQPLADRVAIALAPAGALVAARAALDGERALHALRAFGAKKDALRAARDAAAACGGSAWGTAGEARASVPVAEEERFRKLLAEAWAA